MPLEDILIVNQIDNPDVLAVGGDLIIPLGGVPMLTSTPESGEEQADEQSTPEP